MSPPPEKERFPDSSQDTDFGGLGSFTGRSRGYATEKDLYTVARSVAKVQDETKDQWKTLQGMGSAVDRLKEKVDELEKEITKLSTLADKTDRELDRWVQRFITIQGVLLFVWSMFTFFGPKLIPALH